MGVKLTEQERDQFAVDLYNGTEQVIKSFKYGIEYRALLVQLKVHVLNADKFDEYALSCKLDLVLNSMIRAKTIEFAIGFEGENTVVKFSILA
jgi:hypothetical protein